MEPGKSITFPKPRAFVWVKELGHGAAGRTVLLRDDILDELFVCKKYSPLEGLDKEALFENFVREIKLLHQVRHPNVVRIFNYYLFSDELTGFILMEYVKGTDIEDHLRSAPEQTNEIFLQAIDGFQYLESKQILHRDIRPQNILVGSDAILKIIDLGFGKKAVGTQDFDKSISLNWWCEPPNEFALGTYDFATEVYFVGKLFEKIIRDYGIDHFKYAEALKRMCQPDPDNRFKSFFEVLKTIQSNLFYEIDFSNDERQWYRAFADQIVSSIAKIEYGTKYVDDIDRLKAQLEAMYRKCMLEEDIQDTPLILRCFLSGNFRYYKFHPFPVHCLRNFVALLKSTGIEKQRIILSNLQTRLDAIERYSEPEGPKATMELDDDIPF